MSKHSICRCHLRGARADYRKKFKKHVKLSVSKFKISPNYCDYEVRLNDGKSFSSVIETSTCCRYDAKMKALYELIDREDNKEEPKDV